MALVPVLNEYDPEYRYYFAGAPRMYWGFATLTYLLPDYKAEDIFDPLLTPPSRDVTALEQGLIYILLPEREAEVGLLRQSYPEGIERSVVSDDGEIVALLFVVAPTS